MLDKSLLVSTDIVEREVEFPNGVKQKVFFKELFDEKLKKYIALLSKDDMQARYDFLAESLCDDKGNPYSIEYVKQFKTVTINTLTNIAAEVNGLGGDEKK